MRIMAIFIGFGALVLLAACDKDSPESNTPNTRPAIVSTQAQTNQQSNNTSSKNELSAGSYTLTVTEGNINLVAVETNRLAILQDLADKALFQLDYNENYDELVTIEALNANATEVVALLLHDALYTTSYTALPNDRGFRLKKVIIGAEPENSSYPVGELFSYQDENGNPLPAIVLPKPAEEIYLGKEEAELTNRLQFATPEERAYAVSELRMDPAGFNAAYQVFMRDDSPEVKLAVLELIEAEEHLLAKQMVAMALNDEDPETVLYALDIIDLNGDFSMVQQVERLYSHPNNEIRNQAKAVRESLTSAYFEPDEYTPSPEHIEKLNSREVQK